MNMRYLAKLNLSAGISEPIAPRFSAELGIRAAVRPRALHDGERPVDPARSAAERSKPRAERSRGRGEQPPSLRSGNFKASGTLESPRVPEPSQGSSGQVG